MKKITVLYHRDADGFGAAFAAWLKFGEEANYIGVQYGEPVPEIAEGTEKLFVLDFSYSREVCETLAENYTLRVIDHHKTAESALAGLSFATFSMNKSGAVLAWEHFHPGAVVPPLLAYIQDYNLWKFELPMSVEVNLAIATLPWDFTAWEQLPTDDGEFQAMTIPVGSAVKAFQDSQVTNAMNNVRIMVFGEHQVPCVNASENNNVLAHAMCEHYPDAPFAIVYCDRQDLREWSVRSIGDFDVSEFAKLWGGGGHKNAAGFETALNWPELVEVEVEACDRVGTGS